MTLAASGAVLGAWVAYFLTRHAFAFATLTASLVVLALPMPAVIASGLYTLAGVVVLRRVLEGRVERRTRRELFGDSS